MNFLIIFVSPKQQFHQLGAGLFEFGVVSAVMAILITVLLQRVSFYHDEAELAAVKVTVSSIQAALNFKLAQGKLPGRSIDLPALAEQNPFNLLNTKPPNYAGEFFSPSANAIEKGNWYFDRHGKMVVYLLNNGNSFRGGQSNRLEFKVKLFRLPNAPAKPSGAPDLKGVTFEQVNG